jgi:hypothetical protein
MSEPIYRHFTDAEQVVLEEALAHMAAGTPEEMTKEQAELFRRWIDAGGSTEVFYKYKSPPKKPTA